VRSADNQGAAAAALPTVVAKPELATATIKARRGGLPTVAAEPELATATIKA